MHKKNLLYLAVVLFPGLLWCQVEPSASGGSGETSDDSLMSMPPEASGSFYPVAVGAGERSNILSAGVLVSGSYNDNILAGETTKPIAAESVEVRPSIRIDAKTARFGGSLSYSPGFVYYTPTTDLNQLTQNAVADFQYRWTPHTTVSVQEIFRQNSTAFSEPYTYSGTTIGAGSFGSPIVIVPYAGQITEYTSGHIGYQFTRSSMIGGSGYFSTYQFSNTAQTEGLFNSNVGGGSGFYSRRLTRTQYFGVSYSYSITNTTGYASTTKSQIVSAFYDFYLGSGFSLSFKGGPEYTSASAPGSPASNTWAPSGNAGIGWHRTRTSLALNYSRSVTTGWGLLGSYTADSANADARYQFTRRLTGGVNGSYGNTKNATPLLITYSATGHTLFGRASVEYMLGEHIYVEGEYSRIHNDYSGISALASSPNNDRVAVTLNYQFQRPLGR